MMFMRVAILLLPIWLCWGVSGMAAVRTDATALYQGIAACLGRYSAQVEYAEIVGDETSALRDLRARFSDLYRALDTGREMMSVRVSAKQAHAQLLWTANAQDKPRRARLATARISAQLATCERLVLP